MNTLRTVSIGILIGLLLGGVLLLLLTRTEEETVVIVYQPTKGPMRIEIRGAVAHPGLYEFTEAATVDDLVRAAGGFTEQADQDRSRLAARVYDGDAIWIPTLASANLPTLTPFPILETSSKINLNVATIEELMELPGIGEKKALEIIQYRTEHGGFKDVSELLKVNGLGEKTIETFYDQITVE